jgi:prophage regulatory protein
MKSTASNKINPAAVRSVIHLSAPELEAPRLPMHLQIQPDGFAATGWVKCDDVIRPTGPLPISRSQFWALVKEREVPKLKCSARVTLFLIADIRKFFLGIEEDV